MARAHSLWAMHACPSYSYGQQNGLTVLNQCRLQLAVPQVYAQDGQVAGAHRLVGRWLQPPKSLSQLIWNNKIYQISALVVVLGLLKCRGGRQERV